MMSFKQEVHTCFTRLINEKIALLEKNLNELKETGAQETKSTAGDKHETALAMIQIEQGHLRSQLREAREQQGVLAGINPLSSHIRIATGSLIDTGDFIFYLSTALGKMVIKDKTVLAISSQSPLGLKLLGLVAGEKTSINGKLYNIIQVY